MTSGVILAIFLAAVLAELLVSLWLDFLNVRHVRRNAAEVPERFRAHVDKSAYQKSTQYTLARARLSSMEGAFDAIVLIVFVLAGGFAWIDRIAVAPWGLGPKWSGVIYFAAVGLLFTALSAPFRYYAKFVIEQRFGFNKMTLRLWIVDLLKMLLLGALLGGPAIFCVLWFMEAAGAAWWIYTSLFLLGVMLFLQWLFPTFIAPLFNKFTPLEDGELKTAVTELARKIRFSLGGIYQMDASRRTRHGNAYFTGWGSSRRIVLFDTLIRALSVRHLVAVLAHEMGHFKLRHVWKNLVLASVFQIAGFYLLSLLMAWPPFYAAFGFAAPPPYRPYRALAIFALCSGPFTFFLTPLVSALSRRYEYQADRFAARTLGNAGELAEALLSLSRDNLSNLTPHPLYSFFHYTHPALSERLDALEKLG
ncbi:MAG: M48 family metallopeptidase [Candidatus Sumerlaeota bacterium]|nr:M48 family metallopeptidase [Candidatus Sumerlaeota bacterium]